MDSKQGESFYWALTNELQCRPLPQLCWGGGDSACPDCILWALRCIRGDWDNIKVVFALHKVRESVKSVIKEDKGLVYPNSDQSLGVGKGSICFPKDFFLFFWFCLFFFVCLFGWFFFARTTRFWHVFKHEVQVIPKSSCFLTHNLTSRSVADLVLASLLGEKGL